MALNDLLNLNNIEVSGKNVVIIGRSNLVGKPLATLLSNHNATVTLCHSKTQNISAITKAADIVICALGKPKFLTADMVKEGATVIDVGINRLEDGSLCGDVDFEEISKKAAYITPVPGGVGPLTVICLMLNCLNCYKLQKSFKKC